MALISKHPLYRRYTFIRECVNHSDESRYAWAQGLDCDFDDFSEFANYVESTIGLPPTPQHRLSRTDQSLGWIYGNLCWRTGSEVVGNNSKSVKIPVRKNSRKFVRIPDVIREFGISKDQVYNRVYFKNYTYQDFRKEFSRA
jgi:hypothetical protein